MTQELTRRQFMLLGCMAGASAALPAAVAGLLSSQRRLRVALIADKDTKIEHMLPLAGSEIVDVVGISGVPPKSSSYMALAGHPALASSEWKSEARELLANRNVEAVVWLRGDKSDPALLDAIRSAKPILLESSLTLADIQRLSSHRQEQIIDVIPRRLPIQQYLPEWSIPEAANEVIIRRKSAPSVQLVDTKWLHEQVLDELAVVLALLDPVDFVRSASAFSTTPQGPAWSGYFYGNTNGAQCAIYVHVTPDEDVSSSDSITVCGKARSISFPTQERSSEASRLYFEHFVAAVLLGDSQIALGAFNEIQRGTSLLASAGLQRG